MPFQKGHPNYKNKGTKNKKTLEREARRKMFDEIVSDRWEKIVKDLTLKDKKYIADQFIGKPPETIKLEGDISLKLDV